MIRTTMREGQEQGNEEWEEDDEEEWKGMRKRLMRKGRRKETT